MKLKRFMTAALVMGAMAITTFAGCSKTGGNELTDGEIIEEDASEGEDGEDNTDGEEVVDGEDSQDGYSSIIKQDGVLTLRLNDPKCVVETRNGYVYSFSVANEYTWEPIKFRCQNVQVTGDNKIKINKGGCIYTSDVVPELSKIWVNGYEGTSDLKMWIYDYYVGADLDYQHINFFEEPLVFTKEEAKNGYNPNAIIGYFKLGGDSEMIIDSVSMSFTYDYQKIYDGVKGVDNYYSLDTAKDVKTDGDSLKEFTCTDSFGNDITFVCDKVTVENDNTIVIAQGGTISSITPTHPILGIRFTGLSSLGDGWVDFGVGYQPICDNPSGHDDFLWSQSNSIMADGRSDRIPSTGRGRYYNIKSFSGTIKFNGFTLDCEKEDDESNPFSLVSLNTEFYGYYTEGQLYDSSKEIFDLKKDILTFYLVFKPNDLHANPDSGAYVYGTENFTVGDLYDKDGNIKNKKTDPLAKGDKIAVSVGNIEYMVELPVNKKVVAKKLYDFNQVEYWNSIGDFNVLVVPYYFAETGFKDSDIELLYQGLGNVVAPDGTSKEYSFDNGKISLSEYFKTSSYGKLNITSYVTEPYEFKGSYAENMNHCIDANDIDGIEKWLAENYPDLCKTCDSDSDGFYDGVIFYAVSDGVDYGGFNIISNSGAFQRTQYYDINYRKDSYTTVNGFVLINENMFTLQGDAEANTLIHEFGHGLGLIDYYDVTYSGIDAVGGFDMQSNNTGDWNAYSKSIVGWTDPKIVSLDEVEKNGSVELTINSFGKTGDCILVPTKKFMNGDATVFDEYLLIDLYTPDGLSSYNAENYSGMDSTTGVRIYHVDSIMTEITEDKTDLGVEFNATSVVYTNAYESSGKYLIELIQSSGENTFTANPLETDNRTIEGCDLFGAGDSFSMETHSQFFYDGKMDNGTEFPYTITVKSIEGDKAVVVISK